MCTLRRRNPLIAAIPVAAVALIGGVSGCVADDSGMHDDGSRSIEDVPHGYVAGAEEASEAQTTMAVAERGSDTVHLLPLSAEHQDRAKAIELDIHAERLEQDGRFVYVSDGGRTIEIIDSGAWTVDHGDHVHFYRAQPRSLGSLTLEAPATTIVGNGERTVIGSADGTVTVLDRGALEDGGRADDAARAGRSIDTDSSTALAAPLDDGLVLAVGDDPARPADRLVFTDAEGSTSGPEQECVAPEGVAILRAGVAIGCRDGVALFDPGPEPAFRLLTYGESTALRADGFGYRPRSNEAAAPAGGGLWSVDAAHTELRHVAVPGAVIASAASPADDATALALDEIGTLRSLDRDTGEVLAQAALDGVTGKSALELDSQRAYVTAADKRAVYEIDYADGLRVARSLAVPVRPDLMVEVGR